MEAHMTAGKTAPLGYFGHTYDAEGRIELQFVIAERTPGGYYMIDLFNWITGDATESRLVSEAWLARESVKLYASREQWVHVADHAPLPCSANDREDAVPVTCRPDSRHDPANPHQEHCVLPGNP